MRILHILDHSIPLHSGYSFRTRAILEQQRALGWETFHVTTPKHNESAGDTASEEDHDGLHFYRTAVPQGGVARLPVLGQWALVHATARRLHQIIPLVQPDILHAHSPALNGEAALDAARRFGLPVVYEVRAFWEDAAVDHGNGREGGARYRLSRALETRVLQRANAVTTICEGLRNEIISRGIEPGKITVIANAVDGNSRSREKQPDAELMRELGLEDAEVLGFIGSFYAYEGLTLLIDALPEIVARRPNLRLLLVGGGPDKPRIQERVRALSLNKFVIFTGRVPHESVDAYYDLIDICVYPRFSMRLTDLVTPLKPLEAMARGNIVVASDVGGHRELVRHGETGLLFPAGDASGLASTVVDVLGERDRWPAYRDAARRFVEEERTWCSVVANYEPVYRSLLRAGSPRRRSA